MNPDPRYPIGQPGSPPAGYPSAPGYPAAPGNPDAYPPPAYPPQPGYPPPTYPPQPGYPPPTYPPQPGYPPSAYPPQPGYPPPTYPPSPGYPPPTYPPSPGYPAPTQYPPPGYQPVPAYPAAYPPPPGYPAAAQYPVSAPTPAGRAERRPGWWRRNWWALPLLLPLLVAAMGHNLILGWNQWHTGGPTKVASGLDGQWVSFAGGRLRLLSLKEARGLTDYDGERLSLPSTVDIWQATIEVDAPDDADLTLCSIELQDDAGAVYSANPPELRDADIDYASCSRPFDAPETGSFTTVATFLTSTVRAAGVRVTVGFALDHDYVWLTPPG